VCDQTDGTWAILHDQAPSLIADSRELQVYFHHEFAGCGRAQPVSAARGDHGCLGTCSGHHQPQLNQLSESSSLPPGCAKAVLHMIT